MQTVVEINESFTIEIMGILIVVKGLLITKGKIDDFRCRNARGKSSLADLQYVKVFSVTRIISKITNV